MSKITSKLTHLNRVYIIAKYNGESLQHDGTKYFLCQIMDEQLIQIDRATEEEKKRLKFCIEKAGQKYISRQNTNKTKIKKKVAKNITK